ncbi:TPA: hypothetical protein ACH3X2_013319 [Trebouxia sp. C0005]
MISGDHADPRASAPGDAEMLRLPEEGLSERMNGQYGVCQADLHVLKDPHVSRGGQNLDGLAQQPSPAAVPHRLASVPSHQDPTQPGWHIHR